VADGNIIFRYQYINNNSILGKHGSSSELRKKNLDNI